jgi:NADH:ubiquinone oxidoreductase subunit
LSALKSGGRGSGGYDVAFDRGSGLGEWAAKRDRLGVDHAGARAYIDAMTTIGTRLFTLFHGRPVGRDSAGNRYYRSRGGAHREGRERRWVVYNGAVDASRVPPEWHAWLHHTTDLPLPEPARFPWQRPHVPNETGTAAGYRPPGHDYQGGVRAAATGDYEAWTPGS